MKPGTLFLVCMGVYFGLHIATRALISNSLQLDEAEQLVLTQDWRWGYGSQPPLYDWIQKAAFSVFGINVFALSLVKNSLLWGLYLFVYLAAREILSSAKLAVFAAASLLLIPNIAWESQRDQTHLILATVCSAATLFVFVRLVETRKRAYYVAFGAIAGLGLMSKYNYLFFPVSLLVGALTLPRLRGALLHPGTWLSALSFLLVAVPHLNWLRSNPGLALSQSYKFKIIPSAHGLSAYFHGGLRFGIAALAFMVVPILLYAPLLVLTSKTTGSGTTKANEKGLTKLLPRALLFGLILTLLLVLFFRVTQIHDRWLEPLLFALPIVLVSWARPNLELGRGKYLLVLAAAAAVCVLGAINGTVLGANLIHRAHNLNIPHAAVAAELRKAGFQKGVIVTDGFFLGGNLKMQFKTSRVIVPEVPTALPSPTEDRLIVVNAQSSLEDRRRFFAFAGRVCGIDPRNLQPQFIEVPADNGPKRTQSIEFVLAPGESR